MAFSSFSSSSWHSWDDVYKPFSPRQEGARAAGHQIPELKGKQPAVIAVGVAVALLRSFQGDRAPSVVSMEQR